LPVSQSLLDKALAESKAEWAKKYQLKVIEAVNHKLPQAVDDSTDIDTFDFSSTKVTIEFPTKPERAMNFFVEGASVRIIMYYQMCV